MQVSFGESMEYVSIFMNFLLSYAPFCHLTFIVISNAEKCTLFYINEFLVSTPNIVQSQTTTLKHWWTKARLSLINKSTSNATPPCFLCIYFFDGVCYSTVFSHQKNEKEKLNSCCDHARGMGT